MAVNQKTVLKEIAGLLKSGMPDNFIKAVLFGSRLSGQSKPGLDYDILIILRQEKP